MPFQNLYNNIFDTDEQGESQVVMLERQVNRYPFFTLAHFFLLKNTEPGHPAFAGIAAKTALHFNHPFYLNEQLHKTADAQVTTDNEFATVFHTPDVFPDEMMEVTDDGGHDKIFPEEVMAGVDGSAAKAGTNETLATDIDLEPTPPQEAPEPNNEPHTEVDEKQTVELTDLDLLPQATEPEPVANIETIPFADGHQKEEEEVQPPKEERLFEPLFATDYFASQGIKLRDEAVPNDKLGKQLRSFTDWLKTMKKVHEGKLPAGSETLDLSVQNLAEKSNKEEEVLTETMAEVYLQQGKQRKAKEIYEKLSLLNPSKIAYFAAKIEQIQ